MQRRQLKTWFLGTSDGLAIVGVKELVFIRRKSTHLSRLGVLFPDIQQGQLGARCMSPSYWWSEWRTIWVRFSRDVVTSSDTCSMAVTTSTCPRQVLFVPVSCGRSDIVCQLSSYDGHARQVLLPLLVVGPFKARSTNYCSRRWYTREPQARLRWSSVDACFKSCSAWLQVDLAEVIDGRVLGLRAQSAIP